MNLSGKWKIKTKVNEVTGKVSYRTIVTTKLQDGTTDFLTIFLNLVKDAKYKGIDNDQYIEVKPGDAWLSFYKGKDENGNDMTTLTAVVKDFNIVEENENTVEVNEIQENDDDLPF